MTRMRISSAWAFFSRPFPPICLLLLVLPELSFAANVPILYVAREFSQPVSVMGLRDSATAVSGADRGRLVLRAADGSTRTLVDAASAGAMADTPTDVADPSLSFDARRVVFSGRSPIDGAWRIYEVGVDGTGLRKITRNDRAVDLTRFGSAAGALASYDDADPCYLADGRICFVSTRWPGIAPDRRLRTTNLYVVNADGTGAHRITSERFGADTPTVHPATGEIVYSRWWRSAVSAPLVSGEDPVDVDPADRDPDIGPNVDPGADGNMDVNGDGIVDAADFPGGDPNGGDRPPGDVPPGSPGYGDVFPDVPGSEENPLVGLPDANFPGLNSWFLATIHPDGSEMKMFSGTGLDRRTTQAYRPSFLPSGEVIGFFLPTTPFLAHPGNFGLRVYSQGSAAPRELSGPQQFFGSFFDIFPFEFGQQIEFPPEEVFLPLLMEFGEFLFASGEPLPDGRILVSATRLPDLDYDIFVQGENGHPERLFGDPGVYELDAIPVIARPTPPVIPAVVETPFDDFVPSTVQEARAHNGTFTFRSANIFSNPPVDSPLPDGLPLGERLFIEFFMNPQRTSELGADEPILIERKEIPPTGVVEMELPAGVPLFEVIRRADDRIAVGRGGQIFHVGGHNFSVAGNEGSCVGCHVGHTLDAVPVDPGWTNLAPSAFLQTNVVQTGSGPSPDGTDANGRPVDGDVLVENGIVPPFPGEPQPDEPFPGEFVEFQPPERLVDRRTLDGRSVWVAPVLDEGTEVTLRWTVEIHGRELILHGTKPNAVPSGDVVVRNAQVTALLRGEVQAEFMTGEIRPEGTRIALDPIRPFDSLRLRVEPADVVGDFGAVEPFLSVAEVELIGRAAAGTTPKSLFRRGDANGDDRINIADPIFVLNAVFLVRIPLRCAAAADANADARINIADASALFNVIFLEGKRGLPAPSESCGAGSANGLDCEISFCSDR